MAGVYVLVLLPWLIAASSGRDDSSVFPAIGLALLVTSPAI
ncbi:MAG: hypothetical protein ACT4PI_04670 [Actinomycetota bacterium]